MDARNAARNILFDILPTSLIMRVQNFKKEKAKEAVKACIEGFVKGTLSINGGDNKLDNTWTAAH